MNNSFASTIGNAWAWQKLLEDSNLQYNWISYADVLQKGIDPKEYKVLILPRVLCLSESEAKAIKKYVKAGGHVIADHQTGIFDQHGKGYAGGKGILDDLFGIKNRPECVQSSLFAGATFTEIDAETYYEKKNFINAGAAIWPQCKRDKGLVVAQRDMKGFSRKKTGRGWAEHMNISVIEYIKVRQDDLSKTKKYRAPIVKLLKEAGVVANVILKVNGKVSQITEATFWKNNGRTYVFVVKNPMKFASEFKATETKGVSDTNVKLEITFKKKKADLKNEITGKSLGSSKKITVDWNLSKAAVISYKN